MLVKLLAQSANLWTIVSLRDSDARSSRSRLLASGNRSASWFETHGAAALLTMRVETSS